MEKADKIEIVNKAIEVLNRNYHENFSAYDFDLYCWEKSGCRLEFWVDGGSNAERLSLHDKGFDGAYHEGDSLYDEMPGNVVDAIKKASPNVRPILKVMYAIGDRKLGGGVTR